MNVGETLIARIIEFLPWASFSRITGHHSGEAGS